MTTTHIEDLGKRIEQLVQGHLAASRQAAEAAVQRAFGSASETSGRPRSRRGPAKGSGRREPAEVAALAERLYQAVCAKPGETMAVLAADVGASARALHRPMTNLRRAGRIRSVGQRHLSRYFPTTKGAVASA